MEGKKILNMHGKEFFPRFPLIRSPFFLSLKCSQTIAAACKLFYHLGQHVVLAFVVVHRFFFSDYTCFFKGLVAYWFSRSSFVIILQYFSFFLFLFFFSNLLLSIIVIAFPRVKKKKNHNLIAQLLVVIHLNRDSHHDLKI